MHTLCVGVEYFFVTGLAGFAGDRFVNRHRLDCMRVVAVGANRCGLITVCRQVGMNTAFPGVCLVSMALATGLILSQ
jgi:hypothetical protein